MENTDRLKQESMREYYDNTDYYERAKNNFADKPNRFNQYTVKNALAIYLPKKGEKVIDIGCGWGNISLALQKIGLDVIGLDYSKKSIEICKKTAMKFGLAPTKFVCRDAVNTKLKPESFDVAYCCDFVEHLYPKIYEYLLGELYRILKKGGKLIIYTPNPSHFLEILRRHNIILKSEVSHVDYKTMARLKNSLITNGFIIKKAFFIESHLPILNLIEKMLLGFIPIFRRRNAVLAIKK